MEIREQDNKIRLTPKIVGGIILVLLLFIFLVQRFSFTNKDFFEVMSVTSRELNKTCPVMQDADTRLDNTEALPNKVFQYNYTLVDMVKDSMDVDLMTYSFEPAMINNARNNPALELFRKNRVTLVYKFKDKLSSFITKIIVTPEKYGN